MSNKNKTISKDIVEYALDVNDIITSLVTINEKVNIYTKAINIGHYTFSDTEINMYNCYCDTPYTIKFSEIGNPDSVEEIVESHNEIFSDIRTHLYLTYYFDEFDDETLSEYYKQLADDYGDLDPEVIDESLLDDDEKYSCDDCVKTFKIDDLVSLNINYDKNVYVFNIRGSSQSNIIDTIESQCKRFNDLSSGKVIVTTLIGDVKYSISHIDFKKGTIKIEE